MELQLHQTMTAPTVFWLLFLSLITDVSCETALFTVSKTPLTATKGSCIEMECMVTEYLPVDRNAYWFWMKDAKWDEKNGFSGTIVYSSKNAFEHPVSLAFKGRVNYTGSPSLRYSRDRSQTALCSILICNLNTSDSGNYSFRYVGPSSDKKWMSKKANLTVEENPCPVTFEQPQAVTESEQIRLICSTLSSCSSRLQIKGLTQKPMTTTYPSNTYETEKRVTMTFEATWQDDDKVFSCQTENNTDKYLVWNIRITVEYAPRNTVAQKIPNNIIENQAVTLRCSSSGRPTPTFQWFKHGTGPKRFSESEWTIPSVQLSDAGKYYCEAENKHGSNRSNVLELDVKYVPRVEVIVMSPQLPFTQGQTVHLSCNVIRSNPPPTAYMWFRNQTVVGNEQTHVAERIEPEDKQSYTCEATNDVGPGQRSDPLQMDIHYKPRNTHVTVIGSQGVKRGHSLNVICKTDANPAPGKFSWDRYSKNEPLHPSLWKSKTTAENSLHWDTVGVDDEACYVCNATNVKGTGHNSRPLCIDVLYPPTQLTLTMVTEVIEGQWVTIDCTVRSSPKSDLSLVRSSKQLRKTSGNNTLQYKFKVTSENAGGYTCHANNGEGSDHAQKTLVVKYSPKNVTVSAPLGLTVNENMLLKLECSAQSLPSVSSVSWLKGKDGEDVPLQMGETFIVQSVTPKDSGFYSCHARNEIGSGKSQQVEVNVRYAPKHTEIERVEEELPDGTRFVTLTCNSLSYPPVTQYTWYMKKEDGDKRISDQQTHTVYSDQPGLYYCNAQNEIRGKMSEPEPVFMDRDFIKIIILALLILFFIVILFLAYRHRRKKPTRQRAVNTQPWWSSVTSLARRPAAGLAEPSRSRDDLLPAQPCAQNGQQSQHRPDNTGASGISTVYCTVKNPIGEQSSAQTPNSTQQRGHELDDALNYASLHFEKKQKKRPEKADTEVVYAVVSKSKPLKKNESEISTVYGNINKGHKGKSPNVLHDDTDSSEEEVDVSYTQVNFVAKPGCKKNTRDSSSSDEEQTQYTQVKL